MSDLVAKILVHLYKNYMPSYFQAKNVNILRDRNLATAGCNDHKNLIFSDFEFN